jgi:hypothetical protein
MLSTTKSVALPHISLGMEHRSIATTFQIGRHARETFSRRSKALARRSQVASTWLLAMRSPQSKAGRGYARPARKHRSNGRNRAYLLKEDGHIDIRADQHRARHDHRRGDNQPSDTAVCQPHGDGSRSQQTVKIDRPKRLAAGRSARCFLSAYEGTAVFLLGRV